MRGSINRGTESLASTHTQPLFSTAIHTDYTKYTQTLPVISYSTPPSQFSSFHTLFSLLGSVRISSRKKQNKTQNQTLKEQTWLVYVHSHNYPASTGEGHRNHLPFDPHVMANLQYARFLGKSPAKEYWFFLLVCVRENVCVCVIFIKHTLHPE